jgi:H+/gluconate symporter-like permease
LGVGFSGATRKLLSENRQRLPLAQVERLNRLLLEDTFPGLVGEHEWDTPRRQVATWASIFGDANLALLIAAVLALWIEKRQRRISWGVLGGDVEKALASAGVIILITAAGGAFGAMLNVARVGETIREVFSQYSQSGLGLLVLAFAISSLLKIAQGSSTVAMITASGMLASVANPEVLGCHPVYMATAIGGGSLFGSWMNDSGFWIFAKMGYLTTEESLRTWTPCLAVVGLTAGVMSVLLAWLWPLVG